MNAESSHFEALLEYLNAARGFDFTAYKRTSLMRRMRKRMQAIGQESFTDYRDYLEVHPEEFQLLFNTILINVTSFFRDEQAWDFIRNEAIPDILQSKEPGDEVRCWSAGCASGEEAYTLAMELAEAMGIDQFRQRVKIYATDVDEDALNKARQASYTPRAVEPIPPDLRQKYFDAPNGRYVFRNDLRRSVIFGHHDLVQDAPISRLDLLVCRNTLIYFNAEAQSRIVARFHFALNDDGFLFLGKSEMLLTHGSLFRPVNMAFRVFSKVPRVNLRDRMVTLTQAGDTAAADELGQYVRLREAAFESAPAAQLVVSRTGQLVLTNGSARKLFGLAPRDIGRPFKDLEASYRPIELRAPIEQVLSNSKPLLVRDVARDRLGAQPTYFDVEVVPLPEDGQRPQGVSITFQDVTQCHHLNEELVAARHEIKTAHEELQSGNEELETTNEELQSAIEELQTTNEELQSTNEEMETMNEELQSTNEELEAMNDELRQRTAEANRANAFLHSILASVHVAVVAIDRDFSVLLWNGEAEELWGLRSGEVMNRSLFGLDIGLPVQELKKPLIATMEGKEQSRQLEVDAIDRRGRTVKVSVTTTALLAESDDVRGAVIVLDTHQNG